MRYLKLKMLLTFAIISLAQACTLTPKLQDVGAVVEAPKTKRISPPETQKPPTSNFQNRLATIFGNSQPTPKVSP